MKKWLIPGAQFVEEAPLGPYWRIPAESLEKVQKRETGPKPAAKKRGAAK